MLAVLFCWSGNVFVVIRTQLENQLITRHLRIGDFGTSRQLTHPNETLDICTGTLGYMAPEVRNCHPDFLLSSTPTPYNPFLADVYSLGRVICEINFGFGKRIDNISELDLSTLQNDLLYQKIIECCDNEPKKRPLSSQLESYFSS